jgi:protein gp37
MNNTKIDWAEMTWNPVTGCLNRCEYCYARDIAHRFGGAYDYEMMHNRYYTAADATAEMVYGEIFTPMQRAFWKGDELKFMAAPYPCGFLPTLHRYRLGEPAHMKKPKNIFVCSMADLFGNWISNDWIREVFKACVPPHRYLFLTKFPGRLDHLQYYNKLPMKSNFWYGTTVTGNEKRMPFLSRQMFNTFLSVEPLLERLEEWNLIYSAIKAKAIQWVIIGAETGNRKGKVVPEKEWIMDIWEACRAAGVPCFMKESLRWIMGKEFVQEFPW